MVKFSQFKIDQRVLSALDAMGFEEATPIQESVLPLLIEGKDVIGQAQTGTGKTAAFGIPLIQAALGGRLSLVLVPTRELAQQVTAEIDRIGKDAGVRAIALFGGAPLSGQARDIQRGDRPIVVATPGRLRDHIERKTLDVSDAAIVVLDEADEMLKMGFVEEVEEVLNAVGKDRQTALFSATMPEPVVRLAERYMTDPEFVEARGSNESVATANTAQFAVSVRAHEKVDVLVRIIAFERPTGALVFRHTREAVDELVRALRQKGVPAEALHGGMVQQTRDAVVARLRDGGTRVLVATNVAARGLDIDTISHVINFDAPRETDAYVHRIGRTGRAGRDGRSFLFVTPSDRGRLRGIERTIGGHLEWYAVPTDKQVHDAVARNVAGWIEAQPREGLERYVEAVVAAVEVRAAARHEGLEAPPLDRRESELPVVKRGPATSGPKVPLTINVGKIDGVRPGDLVGALTNEGGLVGADIGRIDILPRMSVAEVPAARVEHLINTMRTTTIRGRGIQMRVADRWEFRSAEQRKGPVRRVRN